MYKCVCVWVSPWLLLYCYLHMGVRVCECVCVCYDNVNSQASKILLAVDLGNFENNNKSNESVFFSLCATRSLFLSLYISPWSFSSTVPIKNIEEIAFFALKAQHSTRWACSGLAPRDALISKLLRIIVKFYTHTLAQPYTMVYTVCTCAHI